MLNRNGQKKYSSLVHYFLFYVMVLGYFSLTGCFGVRTELIPQRNEILGNLPEKSKEAYLELTQMLDDRAKKVLEEKIRQIKTKNALSKFVEKKLENQTAYKLLLELLPKYERSALKQNFAKAVDLDDEARLIDQYSTGLQMIKNAPRPTQQHYIDLIEVLPEDQAIALKKKMAESTDSHQVDQLIASKLPKSFKQLDDKAKENLSKLPGDQRQEILKSLIKQDEKKTNEKHPKHQDGSAPNEKQPNEKPIVDDKSKPTDPNTPNDSHSSISASELDINTLLEQKVKEQEAKSDEDIPQDDWGPKLPLLGEERKKFLILVMQFSQRDQQYLKELFNKTDPNSIQNFFYVFFDNKRFDNDKRTVLLSTIIYLYKGWPDFTIQLCNDPESISTLSYFWLWKQTFGKGCEALQDLKDGLNNL